jgi:hypothetical protein
MEKVCVGGFREIAPSRRIPLIADTADAPHPDHSFQHHEWRERREFVRKKDLCP